MLSKVFYLVESDEAMSAEVYNQLTGWYIEIGYLLMCQMSLRDWK